MWNHRRQKRHDACMAGHRYLLSCTTKYWTTIVLSASTVDFVHEGGSDAKRVTRTLLLFLSMDQ